MLKISDFGEIIRFDMARTMAGRGRYWTSSYYIDGLLVDTGCAHTAYELEKVVRGKPLHQIVNTHSHEDHIGGNGLLQRLYEGLTIFAHPQAIDVLENPREKQLLQTYRKLFWGLPEPSQANPVPLGALIHTKDHTFHVIHTPGHSPDHLCIYEPIEGWIFTGDLFVGGKDRALRAEYEIWQIIESLKWIANLPMSCMFPGSARVREDPLPELLKKITYLEDLGARVMDLNKKGWGVGAIFRELCGGPMFIEILTLGHFSRRQLILSYLRGVDQKRDSHEG